MRYGIEGANRDSGRLVRLEIEAISQEDAESQAADLGILVSRVQPVAGWPAQLSRGEIDQESLSVLIAETRALRLDVQDSVRATLRFTGTPISKIAWGYFVGNMLLWLIGVLVTGLIFGGLALLGIGLGAAGSGAGGP